MKRFAILICLTLALQAAAMSAPVAVEQLCPPGMGFVPAGEFLKGWDNGEPDEQPEVTAYTPAYCVDEYEYPNARGQMPLADVPFDKAAQLCADQGKRVCTEPEWERACRGPRATIYTNTQDYKQIQCNLNSPGAQAAGANPACGNEFGVRDMTGNLWEWVDGTYSEESPWPLIKGGAFKKGALFASCYARFTQPPESESDSVGFRCCAAPSAAYQEFLTQNPDMDPQYDAACPGAANMKKLVTAAYRQLRDPDVTFMYFFSNARALPGDGAMANLFVHKENGGFVSELRLENGAVAETTHALSADAARSGSEALSDYLKTLGPPSHKGCSGCGANCHYVYSPAPPEAPVNPDAAPARPVPAHLQLLRPFTSGSAQEFNIFDYVPVENK